MVRIADVFVDALPALDPIVAHEVTEYGWRGLTAVGEVFEIRGSNGHRAEVPEGDLLVVKDGKAVGRRAITNDPKISIDAYLAHSQAGIALYKENECEAAIAEMDALISIYPTARGRFSRAMMLLGIGRWAEGFAEYLACEEAPPFQRPLARLAIDNGLPPWRGEELKRKRLLLLHTHGYGDTIMCLRYVPQLQARGADVKIVVPRSLERLVSQVAPVVSELQVQGADFFCPVLSLPYLMGASTPDKVIPNIRLLIEPEAVAKWH